MVKASVFDGPVVHCAPAFNQPGIENFGVLVVGWSLVEMRAMSAGALRAPGAKADEHFFTYYCFFSRAV